MGAVVQCDNTNCKFYRGGYCKLDVLQIRCTGECAKKKEAEPHEKL